MRRLSRSGMLLFLMLLLIVSLSANQGTGKEDYNKGVAYATEGKFKEARKSFEKAVEKDPFDSSAENGLKIVEDVMGQKIENETTIHIFKGIAYRNNKMLDDAIVEYNAAIGINPEYADAYHGRGNIYMDKDDYDLAIADYNKAVELNPEYVKAYNNRGAAYIDKGEHALAMADYRKAIEQNPEYAKPYYNRGNAHMDKGDYDLAIADYNKAVELNPGNADTYYNRGIAYMDKGDYTQAIENYSKFIELNPGYAKAYNKRGFVYLVELGNKEKGCEDWKRACELGICDNYNLAKRKGYCK